MSDHDSDLPRDPAARERELLSAFMDGETSEHEMRQVLKTTGDDPALLDTFSRWHLAQSVLRGERVAPLDLRASVAAAIASDAAPAAPQRQTRRWLQPLAGAAVAAAVAVVTVFGWQSLQGTVGSEAELASSAAEAQSVALGPMVVVHEDGEELVMPADNESPTAAQDRLNAYLARHAQATGNGSTGVSPYARVVSFEGEQGR